MYESAIQVLNILENNGYKAYIVGGFVRNKLLNINSDDIDITTNAKPYEISTIFNKKLKDNYGTIKLIYNNYEFEITTFRNEVYSNNKRTPKIQYIDDLISDLKRRDFTINSICIDKDGKYIDLLNGVNDINSKIIKTIGNSDKKIYDDPLRIIRAIRFSLIYNLLICDDLKKSILKYKNRLKYISFDRIKSEIDIIFKHNKANEFFKLLNDFGLSEILEIKSIGSIIECNNYLGIWAQINYSDNYNFTKNEKKVINDIKKIINSKIIDNYTLYKFDISVILVSAKILNISEDFSSKYEKLKIHKRSDINIKYDDIFNITKFNINKIYIDLERQILYNKLKNEKSSILSYIKSNY